jgi:hypothetical protein
MVFNDCCIGPIAIFIMGNCVARVLRALFSAILSRPACISSSPRVKSDVSGAGIAGCGISGAEYQSGERPVLE